MSRSTALRRKRGGPRRLRSIMLGATLASLIAMLTMTSPASAASAPSIGNELVSQITEHDATLEAYIDPNGLKTTYQFRLYSGCLPPAACLAITPYPLPSGEIPASSEPQPVSLDLNSAGVTLKPNTRYAYSVEATNTAGTSQGAENQFTTLGPPVIESESVSHVTPTDATIEAQINPNGLETEYQFWLMYANCQSPPSQGGVCESISVRKVGEGTIPAASSSESVSTTLTQLQPGYSYTYWALATNSAGEAVGEYRGFTTQSADPPSIESESVSHITPTDATLEATINSEGLGTSYEFFLQPPEPACLEAEPPCMIPQHLPIRLEGGHLLGSFVGQSVSVELNSAGVTLAPGATYKYWVSATNAAGTTTGQRQSFTTPGEVGVQPLSGPAESSGSSDSQPSPPIQSPSLSSSSATPSHHRRHRHHRRHKRGLRSAEAHRARHAG